MATWDRSDVLALIAIAVAVVAIAAGALAAQRWGTRRGRITLMATASSLIPEGYIRESTKNLLKVTWRDIDVEDPHMVLIGIFNTGPRDISSAHFDGGKPLLVRLNCKMFGVTALSDHSVPMVSGAIGDEAVIQLGPHLLRKGEVWAVNVIVGGRPRPELVSPLIDTDVEDGTRPAKGLIDSTSTHSSRG
ncbi:hypothetical protein JNW91_08580 [Micromonospora sp. STR1_7]|uniref:DUF4352 domain-containing protein n=1 Tax=Micromonospora parastrephiae TaxID=2806101 RepID=A0ABS1XRM5_9ACTN|nr:hypothetical protein [Micromonospora parastrephiae]MBM0231907.1 hypothetical protein [Micromonospora parastrephiae]